MFNVEIMSSDRWNGKKNIKMNIFKIHCIKIITYTYTTVEVEEVSLILLYVLLYIKFKI